MKKIVATHRELKFKVEFGSLKELADALEVRYQTIQNALKRGHRVKGMEIVVVESE